MTTNYIIDFSLKNGLGHPSLSLYLPGCDIPIKCHNCHNQELHSGNGSIVQEIPNITMKLTELIDNYSLFSDKLYITILGVVS